MGSRRLPPQGTRFNLPTNRNTWATTKKLWEHPTTNCLLPTSPDPQPCRNSQMSWHYHLLRKNENNNHHKTICSNVGEPVQCICQKEVQVPRPCCRVWKQRMVHPLLPSWNNTSPRKYLAAVRASNGKKKSHHGQCLKDSNVIWQCRQSKSFNQMDLTTPKRLTEERGTVEHSQNQFNSSKSGLRSRDLRVMEVFLSK